MNYFYINAIYTFYFLILIKIYIKGIQKDFKSFTNKSLC